eukprot:4419087-Pleurochrysis_carterae.AAC.7
MSSARPQTSATEKKNVHVDAKQVACSIGQCFVHLSFEKGIEDFEVLKFCRRLPMLLQHKEPTRASAQSSGIRKGGREEESEEGRE